MKQPTIDECIEIARERIEDAQYWLKEAKAPYDKRAHKKKINSWSASLTICRNYN